MAVCGVSTGQCIWIEAEAPVCCPPWNTIYEFIQMDTFHHSSCLVGIPDEPQAGQTRSGQKCGFGCAAHPGCDDVQDFLALHDLSEGTRWLEPSRESLDAKRDAFGMLHDLRSNEHHPVPARIVYRRGTCWKNDGTECFGMDVCGCSLENTAVDITNLAACPDGTVVGDEMRDFRPDDFFNSPMGWPPRPLSGGDVQTSDTSYCRKFQDTRIGNPTGDDTHRVTKVIAAAPTSGVGSLVEHMLDPIILSTNVCLANKLVPCMGIVPGQSPCPTPERDLLITQHWYNIEASRQRFNHLVLGNSAQIVLESPGMGDRNKPSIRFKNKVLDFVRDHDFGDPPANPLRFDRLDFAASVPGLYQRAFVAADTGPEIPGLFGPSELMKSRCAVTVKAFVQAVSMTCSLVFHHVRLVRLPDPLSKVLPYARFLIAIRLKITATLDDDPCVFQQSWRAPDDPLREIPLTIDPRDGFTVQPQGLDFVMYRDDAGRLLRPSPVVEWRGFLGGHSVPDVFDEGPWLGAGVGPLVCDELADGMAGLEIPGWPVLAESFPDEPAQVYGGRINVGFMLT